MKILIVTGGSVNHTFGETYIKKRSWDRIIAADSGLAHCHSMGILPTDILGDFDSLKEKELLAGYEEKGIPVRTFPARKDYTDTELAILYAKDLGADEITLLGATGTRYDHTLANLFLLIPLEKEGIHGRLVDDHNKMEILIGPAEKSFIKEEAGDYISLLSLSESCYGIDMEGFSYPLKDASLKSCVSLGISNEIVENQAILRLREGILLVIEACD